jgi:hypothetical protein
MRDALNGLLRQASLLVIAAAIALGLTFLRVAESFGQMVVQFIDSPAGFDASPLSFRVGDRVLFVGQLLQSLIAFAIVLAAVLYLFRREGRRD